MQLCICFSTWQENGYALTDMTGKCCAVLTWPENGYALPIGKESGYAVLIWQENGYALPIGKESSYAVLIWQENGYALPIGKESSYAVLIWQENGYALFTCSCFSYMKGGYTALTRKENSCHIELYGYAVLTWTERLSIEVASVEHSHACLTSKKSCHILLTWRETCWRSHRTRRQKLPAAHRTRWPYWSPLHSWLSEVWWSVALWLKTICPQSLLSLYRASVFNSNQLTKTHTPKNKLLKLIQWQIFARKWKQSICFILDSKFLFWAF